ncbi:hypothetical protein FQN54_006538 [Arachnomyces sp. PD_36]|nr:hypothetical protein FQN54_006538 [Arachnomyces sp. PD_36]
MDETSDVGMDANPSTDKQTLAITVEWSEMTGCLTAVSILIDRPSAGWLDVVRGTHITYVARGGAVADAVLSSSPLAPALSMSYFVQVHLE